MNRIIKLDECEDCQHMNKNRYYTEDSFEMCFTASCAKKDNKKICIVDWNKNVDFIPDWCPLEKR